MKSFLTFSFLLVAVFSFVNVKAEAEVSEVSEEVSEDVTQLLTEEDLASIALDSVIEDIESEIEDVVADTASETTTNKPSLPLMFPGLTQTSKTQRTMNKDMAVKMASLVEQAVLLVANDILQTAVLLTTDPADFLNSTSTTTSE